MVLGLIPLHVKYQVLSVRSDRIFFVYGIVFARKAVNSPRRGTKEPKTIKVSCKE